MDDAGQSAGNEGAHFTGGGWSLQLLAGEECVNLQLAVVDVIERFRFNLSRWLWFELSHLAGRQECRRQEFRTKCRKGQEVKEGEKECRFRDRQQEKRYDHE